MDTKAMILLLACMLLVSTRVSSIEEEIDTEAYAKAPAHAPPAYPPVKVEAPFAPVAPKHGCVPKCEELCKTHRKKRPCMKACTACCAKCKCVPGAQTCSNWDHVIIHGAMVKCP